MNDRLSNDLAALRIARESGAPPSPWPKRLLILAVVAALAWAAWRFGYPMVEARVFKPEVEVTQIAIVSPSQAEAKLTSTGYVVPQRISKVGAKTPGRIKVMHVAEGTRVEAGMVLAELEGADLRAQLHTSKARVLTARAQVQTAKAELADATQKAKRERKLAAAGVGAAAAAEDLEARVLPAQKQVAAAEAAVKAAEAEVASIEVSLEYLTIISPIAGIVTSKPSQAGELVGIQAASLVEITDFDSLLIETDVPEGRLHLIKPKTETEEGDPCEITLDAFPTERYLGSVVEIAPKINRAKATITVKVAFDEPNKRALPDMAARVTFLSERPDKADMDEPARVIVPEIAVTDRDGNQVVFVLEDGTARMHAVELGEAIGTGFELLKGPPAGAMVVRDPSTALFDGQKVKQKGEST
jgi:RND family efflux transporter MFP subunit